MKPKVQANNHNLIILKAAVLHNIDNMFSCLDSSLFGDFGPSGVRALPLAAGINVGGHYFRYIGLSEVRALPLAAGINVGGHDF